jgi:hypothetical protein
MPLAHPGLRSSGTPLLPMPGQRKFSANWSGALVLGTLVFATLNPSWAQDTGVVTTAKPNPLYPDEVQITFQWNYACPIYLGTLPLNGVQQERAAAIFYDFSSREFPHSSGFAISTGINSLSCQVNGMILNHSGPPAKKSKPDLPGDTPMSQLNQ